MKFKRYAGTLTAGIMLLCASLVGVSFNLAASEPDQSKAPAQAFNLRSNQVRTRHLIAGAVTAGKLGMSQVTVNVNAASATGSSAAAPALVGGTLTSCRSSGNQDQFMDNVVLNGDGSITITLAAAATAQNNFICTVIKADAKGVS